MEEILKTELPGEHCDSLHCDSIESWLARHRGLLFKVVHSYARNAAEADDLFQELSLQLWRSLPQFKGQCSEGTWVYKVALFSAVSWLRKEVRHRNHASDEALERVITPCEQPDPRLAWVYARLRELNDIDRSVCLLMLEGYQYDEIADILGISRTNVGAKLNRIKQRLARHQQQEANDEL